MMRFSEAGRSEIARRMTNLFTAPNPVEIEQQYLEENLIHRTMRNEAVRSKSEVVIANLLHHLGVDYSYEKELRAPDGSRRLS